VRAATALENVRLYEERDRAAQALQRSLLPSRLPESRTRSLCASSRSRSDLIGGDFYDVFEVAPRSWALVIGDVMGKDRSCSVDRPRTSHYPCSVTEPLGSLGDPRSPESSDPEARRRPVRHRGVRAARPTRRHARLVVASAAIRRRSSCARGDVDDIGAGGMLLGVFEDTHVSDTQRAPARRRARSLHGRAARRKASDAELRLLSIISESKGMDAAAIAERIETQATKGDVVYDDRAVLVLRLLRARILKDSRQHPAAPQWGRYGCE